MRQGTCLGLLLLGAFLSSCAHRSVPCSGALQPINVPAAPASPAPKKGPQ